MSKNLKSLFVLTLILLLFCGCASVSSSGSQSGDKKFSAYNIEKKVMDYKFTINGNTYIAKGGYCHGMGTGDRVIFLEGSPDGDCEAAKIKDLETGAICFFWCKGSQK
jgi:hypothetical protein